MPNVQWLTDSILLPAVETLFVARSGSWTDENKKNGASLRRLCGNIRIGIAHAGIAVFYRAI
jgi:GrpB-like predicted nucleotidyltransferase (UPF0157 family)